MDPELKKLIDTLDLNQPADLQMIRKAEEELAIHFPDEFIEFLQYSNGASGYVGESDNQLNVWGVYELKDEHTNYRVEKYAPGLVLFGSDGVGNAYAFDTRNANLPVVTIPFVPLRLSEVKPCKPSFFDFIKALGSSEGWEYRS
ncbi:MAG: SMI1/KNR4 family protein [Paenibacillaceae bacterium]|nr:SMI1/KNR4 family protein [Paenibacillaceae bacterium]